MQIEESLELTGLSPTDDGYYKYKFTIKLSEVGEIREAIDDSNDQPIPEWTVIFKKGQIRGILCIIEYNKLKALLFRHTYRITNSIYLEALN